MPWILIQFFALIASVRQCSAIAIFSWKMPKRCAHSSTWMGVSTSDGMCCNKSETMPFSSFPFVFTNYNSFNQFFMLENSIFHLNLKSQTLTINIFEHQTKYFRPNFRRHVNNTSGAAKQWAKLFRCIHQHNSMSVYLKISKHSDFWNRFRLALI